MLGNIGGATLLLLVVGAASITRAWQAPFQISQQISRIASSEQLILSSSSSSSSSSSLEDRATIRQVHLSHSGLYLGSPISAGAPSSLTLHVDVPLYSTQDIKISAGTFRVRDWEQVHLGCGPVDGGGIEACEAEDLKEVNGTDRIISICTPAKILPAEGRVLIDAESCPVLAPLLSRDTETGPTPSSRLESLALTFEVQRAFPARREKHHFWLGRLHRNDRLSPDGGALWPLTGTAHGKNDSTTTEWDGLIPNRIASLMQDPYLPKASKPASSDPLNGVDINYATWSYGVSIRAPTNECQDDVPSHETVRSPVAGQVVWTGDYTLVQAPGNHKNDENGSAVMIRDDWGMVYQLLGLDTSTLAVEPGRNIQAGHVLGGISREQLSEEPPCRHAPADPPKMDDDSRRYPYRSRQLRLVVARPDPSWPEWRAPFESGWQYFNPLDAFTRAGRVSKVTPDPNPTQVFFARPSEDGGLTPPAIIATSKDLLQPPTVSEKVEVIVGFDAFLETPGNAGDRMDPTALHALDWAVVPAAPQAQGTNPRDTFSCQNLPEGVDWRTTFEHTKLPNAWTINLPKTSVLAHYVPAFTSGSLPFFKTKYASVFDEKARKLYYAPTRNLVGQPDGHGFWDTRKETGGDGLYQFWVRGRDWFGNIGCFGANVRIRNGV